MKLGGCILLLRNTTTPLKTNMIGWKIPMFNRKYIFKWRIFHCNVSFRRGVGPIIIPQIRQFPNICSLKLLDFIWLLNTAGIFRNASAGPPGFQKNGLRSPGFSGFVLTAGSSPPEEAKKRPRLERPFKGQIGSRVQIFFRNLKS